MDAIEVSIVIIFLVLLIVIPVIIIIQIFERMKRQRLELRIEIINRQNSILEANPTITKPIERASFLLEHICKIILISLIPIIPIYIFLTNRSLASIFTKITIYFLLIGSSYFFAKAFRWYRYKKIFIKQLPDVIEMVIRSLRAGRTITDSIKTVGEENRGPVADQFRSITDQFELGRDFIAVVSDISNRLRIPEFTFFVIVLSVQQETGGNIIKILSSLVNMLRQRELMLLKIKALSAEGIFSAIFMLSLPLVVMGIFFLLRPEYISVLFTEPKGQYMLLGGAATEILGCLVIFRMVKIDV